MPRSRGRKKKPKGTVVKFSPEELDIIREQRERFRQKFGRDPGPNDPVFFDPDASEPAPMPGVDMEADILNALRKAGAPPEFAYAYRKTGLLSLRGDMSLWPKDRVKEWQAAVAEYHLFEQARKDRGPTPEGWNTEIPELLASPFSQEDFDHVQACLKAMAPVEASRPRRRASSLLLRPWPRPVSMPLIAPVRPVSRRMPRTYT
jgi:hypothetical protein